MVSQDTNYARSQADAYDNIAPTSLQGQQAWQFAQTDNFFSPEEAAAVIRQQIQPYRDQIEAKLTQLGFPPEHLAKSPVQEAALYSGQQTDLMKVIIAPGVTMEGRLRIAMGEDGPDIRFTPSQQTMAIPEQVSGLRLSRSEQMQLAEEGSLSRPLMMQDKGEYVPTYLRLDPQTNTVELWRLKTEQLPTKVLGIDLTKDQQLQLVNGYPVRLSGLLDNQGEPFNATVSISPAKQALHFSDINRMNLGVNPDQPFKQQVALNNEGAKTDLTRGQETAIGAPIVNNQQAEATKQTQPLDPQQQEGSAKLRR